MVDKIAIMSSHENKLPSSKKPSNSTKSVFVFLFLDIYLHTSFVILLAFKFCVLPLIGSLVVFSA